VGLTVDRDHGLRVTKVSAGSAAEQAGIKAGDELAAAGGRRLFSQADFRGVLHRGPRDAGSIDVYWLRDGAVKSGTLKVGDGWRKTVLDWRMSVSQGNVGAGPDFFPLAFNADKRKARGIAEHTMAVEPYLWPKSAAQQAGLRGSDCVTAVDGQTPDVAGRRFLVWFRRHHEPGDEVTLTVKDAQGKERKVSYRLSKQG
jgi:S1-C subfamily serine protease